METDPSLRLRVTPAGSRMCDHAVMLSPFVALRVNSAKHLEAQRERPFAAAQGDSGGADGFVISHNRPLRIGEFLLREPQRFLFRMNQSFCLRLRNLIQ
jgi:hypothetical protein